MTFKEWWNLDVDTNEEWLCDVSGGDWDDLMDAIKLAYEAGFEQGKTTPEESQR